MDYTSKFKNFTSHSSEGKGFATYLPLTKSEFKAICFYVALPNEDQLILFPLFHSSVQVTIKLVKILIAGSSFILYKDLAQELSLNEKIIKLRLSNLEKSGFPLHLTNTAVRMKTRAECQFDKKD